MRHSNQVGLGTQVVPTREALAEAFADFTRAAGLLEFSYHELQREVAGLRQELEDKNRHLARSLGENESIRLYLQNLLAALPCGVAVLDGPHGLQLCNPEATRLLAGVGDAKATLAGIPQEQAGEEYELVLTASGQTRYVTVRPAKFETASGEAKALLILRDTTAQHGLEEERQHARCMEALAESSALLAHEVRNPLASMELFASLLVDATTGGGEDVRNWARHIQAGLRIIAATVNNVLHLRNPSPLQLRMVDLPDLLGSTVELLDPVAHQCGVHINFLPSREAVMIQADQSRLQQVFFNLAVNAFRAMQPGGILTIRVGPPTQNVVRVEFSDQGCGIAPDDLERIFEPGFSRAAGGSGFGLAVCRKIMDQHAGTIHIASQTGVGTAVSLTFVHKGEAA